MALPTGYSAMSAIALSIFTFAAMQLFKDELSTDGVMTILGGFFGSWIFVFLITIAGNVGSLLLGEGYHVKIFPEVIICLVVAMGVSATVHRVCATTCLIFSLVGLYFINKVSHATYSSSSSTTTKVQKTTTKSSSRSGKSKNK